MTHKQISQFLSYVLRHKPDEIGLTLDVNGWASVDALLEGAAKAGKVFDEATLRAVVAESDKKRFTLSEDGLEIRAAQGHSIQVDLAIESSEPPATLYHGTALRNLESIFEQGLKPKGRLQVHLSTTPDTARKVGARHGEPVVLIVDARRMHAEGFAFVRAENGVWLTDAVAPIYLARAD